MKGDYIMRINFNLPDDTYQNLKMLSAVEGRSITDIVTVMIDSYINAHSTQLEIMNAAMSKARKIK